MLKIPYPDKPGLEPREAVSEEIRRAFQDVGQTREYSPGETIIGPHDGGERIGLLISGEASVLLRENEDHEIPVATLKAGDLFGEISFLTGRPAPSDAGLVADDRCRVVEVTAPAFETILKQHPELSLTLMRGLAGKIMRLDRGVYRSKLRRRALQSVISRENHIFPDYVIGEYVSRRLGNRIEDLAHSEGPVLIIGETGVGKEVLAHAIYKMAPDYKEVFLLLDMLRSHPEPNVEGPYCEPVIEDEYRTAEQLQLFFGCEKRGPDGAVKVTPGYVELTEDGTLLVRGVEHLTPEMQRLLLNASVNGTFTRPGGLVRQEARFKLLATTELDPDEIEEQRHPLIHGLLGRSITVPPLRKRRREIPSLVEHYLSKYSQELRKDVGTVPKETMKSLVSYSWPGNDVELSTTLKRAVLVAEGGVLRPADIYFDLKRVEGVGKFNLFRFNPARQAVLSPLFPAVLQSAVTPFFFILLAFLFLGPADPAKNPAALFSWAVGWPILIIGAFVWARFWCTLCPVGMLSQLAKKVLSLDRPFPTFLKTHSDFLIAGAVLLIIWFETATGIRNSPFNLGLLLLAMLVSAVVVSVVFERQAWCRYLCGLGGMIGVLSKASMVELRADRNVCISQCTTNECLLGTAEREGCPFNQAGPKLHSNRLCKLCGACVKNCPHAAINLNLRIPGQEIWEIRHTNAGTAFLVIGMMGGLLSELLSKTESYMTLQSILPGPQIVGFSLVFLLVVLGVNLLLFLATACSHEIFGDTFKENYSRYGLALLPLVLTSFMAFHVYYLINVGVVLPRLAGETFDFDLFRSLVITVPGEVTQFVQQGLVLIGLAWTLLITYRLGKASHPSPFQAAYGILPHAGLAVALALVVIRALGVFFQSHS